MRFEAFSGIALPVQPSLDLGSSYSFAMWVYPERYPQYNTILKKAIANRDSDPYFGLLLGVDPTGHIYYDQSTGAPGSQKDITPGTVLPLNTWSYLTVTSDGATIILYMNGVELGRTSSPGPIPVNNLPLSLGAELNVSGYECCGFAGFVRQLSAWNRPLAASEIQSGMTSLLTGSESGLAGYWPLDDGPGYSFRDLGPNQLNGVLRYPSTTFQLNGVLTQTPQYQPAWFIPQIWLANPFNWSAQPQATHQIGEAQRLIPIDFDNDGNLDLISAGYWSPGQPQSTLKAYRNDGQGHFTEVTSQVLGASPPVVLTATRGFVADLNHDGRQDLIIGDFGSDFTNAGPTGGQNRVLMQTADGQLADETSTRMPLRLDQANDMDGADINGDGNIDLIFAGDALTSAGAAGFFHMTLMMNDGTGHFAIDDSRLPADAANKTALVTRFLDANGDGYPDLFLGLYYDTNTATDLLLLNDGTGHFNAMISGALPPRLGGGNCSTINAGMGDLNGDGYPDIILSIVCDSYTEGGFQVLINRGDGTFFDATAQWLPDSLILPSPIYADAFPWMRTIQFADFNSDGRLDVVMQSLVTRPVFYLNTGNRLMAIPDFLPNTDESGTTFGSGGGDVALADFNNDGRPDIVVADNSQLNAPGSVDTLWVGLNERNYTLPSSLLPAPSPSPRVLSLNIVNAASFSSDALAPGTRVRIRGAGIGPDVPVSFPESPGSIPPTSLDGVTVTFGSIPAQLLSVSSNEVVAIVPFALAGQWISSVQVAYAGAVTAAAPFPITASNPQVYGTRASDGTVVAQAWTIVNGTRTPVTGPGQLNWGDQVAFRVTGAGQGTTPLADGAAPTEQPFTPSLPFTFSLGSLDGTSRSLPIVSMSYAPDGLTGVVEVVIDLPAVQPQGVGAQFYVSNARFSSAYGVVWPLSGPGGPAGACTYSVAPSALTVSAAGGSQTPSVSTSANCPWTAVPAQAWTSITSVGSGLVGIGNGSVSFSAATNAGATSRSGSLTVAGQTVILNQLGPPSNGPVITGVSNAAGGQPGVYPGSFVSIYGSNFTSLAYADWSNSITNGKLPTQLDGVSVSIGGTPAYINAITPGQINVQAPNVAPGRVEVTVATPTATSSSFAASSQQYGPAFWPWPDNQPVATHLDYTFAAKGGSLAGATTVPAKPGEVIILWGTGFGPTSPVVPAGQLPGQNAGAPTLNPVTVTLNGIGISVLGAALSSDPGNYQVSVQIPTGIASGSYPLVAIVDGVPSPTTTFTVQQ
jgi:uncharacterized protein (TIGR03437 family)